MWSLGCIIYELVTHNVLFNYGYQKKNLAKALAINRKFSCSMFSEIRDTNSVYDEVLTLSSLKVSNEEKCFIFPKINYDFVNEMLNMCQEPILIDFVKKCLVLKPTDRLTPDLALCHEFLKKDYK